MSFKENGDQSVATSLHSLSLCTLVVINSNSVAQTRHLHSWGEIQCETFFFSWRSQSSR